MSQLLSFGEICYTAMDNTYGIPGLLAARPQVLGQLADLLYILRMCFFSCLVHILLSSLVLSDVWEPKGRRSVLILIEFCFSNRTTFF